MNKIFECSFGSKLYGTALPTSDDDRKSVFIENLNAIILNKARETVNEQNMEIGVDYEYKELRRFIFDVIKGQTYALELLFVPKNLWLIPSTNKWEYIIANRHKLISKSVHPFLGFAIGQAQKYSLKGQKYNDLSKIIWFVEQVARDNDGKFTKSALWDSAFSDGDHASIEFNSLVDRNSIIFESDASGLNMTNFLGKKFYDNVSCKEVLRTLHAFKDRYGDRAKQAAQTNEVDFKAYYHSVRLLDEVTELLDTGKITFPRPNAQHLLDIRLSKIDYDAVVEEINTKVEIVRTKMDTSTLPEKADQDFWDAFLIQIYRGQL